MPLSPGASTVSPVGKRNRRGKQHHPRRQVEPPRRGEREPDLVGDTRRALHAGDSFQLLSMVSGLLAVVDPRSQDPFARARGEESDSPTLHELVESFDEVDIPETTALLSVIAEMTKHEMTAARARRAVRSRHHRLPEWLVGLTALTIGRVVEMTHVLGDGDNIAVEVRTGAGDQMTVLVYIDHNMGTLIKDAFVIPEPVETVIDLFEKNAADPDTRWADVDAADARARITEAGELAAMMYPPLESETWPACRPLVEWVTRHLPPDGTGYVRPEWDESDRERLAGRFFASPYASSLDDVDRDLFDSVLWFACDYGPGDPLRWSPVSIEMILVDWLPRKVIADPGYLGRAPDLLRAYVRFCHDERGITAGLTEETLEAIDRWEPQYRAIIENGTYESLRFLDSRLDEWEPPSHEELVLASLAGPVGSEEALWSLDAEPLPDEPFDWEGIAADISSQVEEVLQLCDRYCDEHLEVEYRTACRRLLARIARGDPEVFRRRARADTAAGAVCWAIGRSNRLFRSDIYVKDMMAWFGIKGGVSQRAATLLRAAGIDADRFKFHSRLGTPDLLVSSRRASIIGSRDRDLPARS